MYNMYIYVYDLQTLWNTRIKRQRRFYWVSAGPELREQKWTWRAPSSSGPSRRKRGSSSSPWFPPSLFAPACSPRCRTLAPLCKFATKRQISVNPRRNPSRTDCSKGAQKFRGAFFPHMVKILGKPAGHETKFAIYLTFVLSNLWQKKIGHF